MEIIYIIFGWVLGLLSPVIVDKIKSYSQKDGIKRAIFIELKEISVRLVGQTYLLSIRYGAYNKELIEWVYKHFEPYIGSYVTTEQLDRLRKFIQYSDEQFEAYANQIRVIERAKGLNLKKFDIPCIMSHLKDLNLFNDEFQIKLLEIKSHIGIINDEIDNLREYFKMTFDSSLSIENRKIVESNLTNNYSIIASRSRKIVEMIDNFIEPN